MCGLAGVYGEVDHVARGALFNLMMFSQLRGVDSTGVVFIPANPKAAPLTRKTLGGVESLMTSFPLEFSWRRRSIDKPLMLAILSHHRAATVGAVTEDNAHPFSFDDIIGTHNGTIPFSMYSKLPNHLFGKTDSEVCLGYIDTFEEPHKAFEKIGGEFAFTWFDSRDDTLCLARNDHRTLYTAKTTNNKTLFYASESWMLHIALDRAGVKWGTPYKDEEGKDRVKREVRAVLPNKVHRFGLNDTDEVIIYSSESMVPFVEPEPPVYSLPNYSQNNNGGWWKDWVDKTQGKKEQKQGKQEQKKVTQLFKPSANREEFVEDYAPYLSGQMLHKMRWTKLVNKGCSFCSKDILWQHRKELKWVDKDTVLCPTCSENKSAKVN